MKYHVEAFIEAPNLLAAWEAVQYLPNNFTPDECEIAVGAGVCSFSVTELQAGASRGRTVGISFGERESFFQAGDE